MKSLFYLAAGLAFGGVQHVAAAPKRSKAYDMPLTAVKNVGYTSEIFIGTPPQSLTISVDWTWISQFVLTTTCRGNDTDTSACLSPDQQLFNQSKSRTYKDESALYPSRVWNPNQFFFYKDMEVDHASDILTVGPAASRIVMQGADFQFSVSPFTFPFAGVFGLSPVFAGDNASYQAPFYQGWKNGVWPSPITAGYFCYEGSPDKAKSICGGADAIQTLGGYAKERIDGKALWYDNIVFPEVNNVDFKFSPAVINYWALDLTSMKIGNESQAINKTHGAGAIFDNASYGQGAPLSVDAYERLIALSDAKPITLEAPPNNGNQSWYEVDCSKKESLPPLKYQFAGHAKEWEIIPSHYVDDIGNNTCVLNVRTLGFGDMLIGNFGDTFAKDKYIMFDFDKLQVGIADLKW
ncbi:hypothetical protein W97_05330 [Coniosporium apollinis CBS 100218]|uniref:Peptidase A1 domain-containing protein n=1 Tax=Coniosporium apollinis (strain CBS 100218) TaxID=1168221 RepID=R7YW35_CONA1|nr:uncharacterized protein W97_05330 [Coniosporium apollinis CBS 100218]EON66087.1 hypothetical protein W97_05330 [Coniosporium apollinis CBS 100218]